VLDDFHDTRFRELLLLDRVVALGTITAAAEELGIPKPTAGRWLALLEDRVGGSLLVRGARSTTLTARGRTMHGRMQAVLRSMGALRTALQSDRLGGTLRVSVPVPFGRLVGGTVLAGFHRALPAVRLEVLLNNRRVDLATDRIDLALRGGALPDSDLVARKLASVPIWLYAAAGRSKGAPLFATPGDEAMLQRHTGVPRRAAVLVDDRLAVRDALLQGVGEGLLPTFLGEQAHRSGTLERVGNTPVATLPVHAVWLPGPPDSRVRVLLEHISTGLEAWTP
jgi:DNA-binding transcriptional LysR family regulator